MHATSAATAGRAVLLAVLLPAVLALVGGSLAPSAAAQEAPVNGMRPADLRAHAIVGATVVVRPGQVMEQATIVIDDGVIVSVGPDVQPPDHARVWSAEGLTVYAGFIDSAVLVEAAADRSAAGAHWNGRIQPQLAMIDRAAPASALRRSLRGQGVTAAAFYPEAGLFRGTGSVLALAEDDDDVLSYRDRAAMAVGFDRGGSFGGTSTPGSLMGAIALIRQTLLDAQWHAECLAVHERSRGGHEPPARADALAALRPVIDREQPILVESSDEHNALRAGRIAGEFDLDLWILGSGTEFRRASAVAALGAPVLVPVSYPDAPDVSALHDAQGTTLRDLLTWELAPTNARRLVDAGVEIAFTSHGLSSHGSFLDGVRKAVEHGLDEDAALAALTTTRARLLGLEDVLGTIEPGKVANLVVVNGAVLEDGATIRSTWINGRRHEIEAEPEEGLATRGRLVTSGGLDLPVTLDTARKRFAIELPPDAEDESPESGESGESDEPGEPAERDDDAAADEPAKAGATKEPRAVKATTVIVQQDQFACVIDGEPFGARGWVHLAGAIVDGGVTGSGARPDGTRFDFSIEPTGALEDDGDEPATSGDDEAAETTRSPVDGTWLLSMNVPQVPEAIQIELRLRTGDDGSIAGTIALMGNEEPIDGGSFDPATGELRFEDPAEDRSIVGTIEGGAISGTARQGPMSTPFTGRRTMPAGGDVASAGDAGQVGGRDADPGDGPDPSLWERPLNVPLGAFGLASAPEQRDVAVVGATIWTCGPDGIIEDGVLVASGGRIAYVGPAADAPPLEGFEVIDADGRHVTPGLIDCHSHTGIDGGVNEWSSSNTAEVRIGDVIDPDDINWYRQLAGGLTAANQLHGSANPIGGQNSVVKLAWGGTAEDFRIDGAMGGIKFALGENVIRSSSRYPNTRMGVETTYLDAFTAAKEYRDAHRRYAAIPWGRRLLEMPPRRDLELEALVEILEGERLVHCHSYRQDEILMLIRVAERFGFTIGTFQHILEGYKVADEIARHGAGGSSFSDWWAYKVEVMDAIPHNGSLMTEVGVVMSFNSDSNELARRMNAEAAKAVRYGGMEPHDALELVTLNPAIQLRIDDRTGSLEVGKDADFVIWSDDPLSTYARCVETWIEGARHFGLEMHAELAAQAEAERQRLIQKVLTRSGGEAPSAATGKGDEADEADGDGDVPTLASNGRPLRGRLRWMYEDSIRWMEEQVRLGKDPEQVIPGVCGCDDMVRWLMETTLRR